MLYLFFWLRLLPQAAKPARGAALTLTLSLLAACQVQESTAPAVLRFSAIPDQKPEQVQRQHEAIIGEVCALAKLQCLLQPAASYNDLVEQFGNGGVDVAFLGGVTFAQARHRHGAMPLAMRDIDTHFTSVVVIKEKDPARSLSDLRGYAFAFGNPSSTSGHFMARYMLEQAGIEPDRFFSSIVFSGNHNATLRMVSEGKAGAGAVNGSVAYRALTAGDPDAKGLRVLWQSPPYTDYVWAARKDLPAEVRQRLTDAFLAINPTLPAHREALERQGGTGFVPARETDFDAVTSVLRRLGKL